MAVDVGGTSMKGGLVSSGGEILVAERRPTPRDGGVEGVLGAISGFIGDLAEISGYRQVGVGLAVPGLVAPDRAVYSAAFGWRDVPVAAFTSVPLPVALGHDVRSAGEAELAYGAARDRRDALFVPIGTGMAAALALSSRESPPSREGLYGGAGGWAGQIGHIPVYPDGLPCRCGQRGCLSVYASAVAIARRCGAASAADVVTRVRAGEPEASRVWGAAMDALALALATATLLLDPEVIVIGGGLSLAGQTLLDPLRERLTARLAFRPAPELATSRLGVQAGLLGAGLLGWRAASAANPDGR
ncbi:ROK family protein [Nonomuraea typhae]|uniref:ROK family protein n=1 Tax=Nonomuraea typhae TaxID=2603600 RepID=UPI001FEB42D5|nr:ROK family protein [Nonomuraea typhae]